MIFTNGLHRICRWLGQRAFTGLLMLGGAASLPASELAWLDEEPEFLPVEEAFVLSTEAGDDGALLAYWDIPDGYYLYRHGFGFTLRNSGPATLGPAQIPSGKAKEDEYFGEVEVYYHRAQARVPIIGAAGPVEVGVSYQGCAEAGLCYPPETRWVMVNAAPSGPPASSLPPSPADAEPKSEEQALAALLVEGGLLIAVAVFFLGGIGLAFTPCVLPMVPILSSIIVSPQPGSAGGGPSHEQTAQPGSTRFRAFTLSLAYVLGMACTYALVGVLMGLFGASLNLQASLQSPPVLVAFALLFALLSLSMFGLYELRLPQRWQNALDSMGRGLGGGRHASVVVMGALSALVVSPCVSAPLAGALIFISATNDAVLGGAALLSLGLGMGVPLLIIGVSGGHLLPRAGAWMNAVKAVFGVLLLAVAIWLLERVLPAPVTLALWAALLIGCGAFLGGLDGAPKAGWSQLWKALGFASALYGVLLLVGAASGAGDPLRPLRNFTGVKGGVGEAETQWRPVKTLADVKAEVGSGRLALLDLYADWCISCKIMERSVFPDPQVASRLSQFHLLRADVTANDAEDQALLDAFGLFGPPSLVFFGADGAELTSLRVQGEISAQALAAHLQAVLAASPDASVRQAPSSGKFAETEAI